MILFFSGLREHNSFKALSQYSSRSVYLPYANKIGTTVLMSRMSIEAAPSDLVVLGDTFPKE
jgi:hypothetical protein